MSRIRGNVPLTAHSIPPEDQFVRAEFDFTPSIPIELKFDKGDVIKILGKVDEFWLEGLKLHNGKTGHFPKDFIKPIVLPKCIGNETLLFALDTFYPEEVEDLSFEKGDIIILEKKINNEWGTGRSGINRGMFPLNYTDRLPLKILSSNQELPSNVRSTATNQTPEGLGKARALMNLTAQLDEELSFCVGDEITITEVLEDGTWYKGKIGSESGTFPASFVELITPLKSMKRKPLSPSKSLLNRTESKEWKAETFDEAIINATNNNNAPGPISLTSTARNLQNGKKLSEYLTDDTLPTVTDAGKDTDSEREKPVIYTVTAIHKFTGNSERELSFDKDLRIPIIEEVDEHWLMGKVKGIGGYVPRSYVTVGVRETDSSSYEDTHSNDNSKKAEKVLSPSKKSYVKMTSSRLLEKHHVYTAPSSNSNVAKTLNSSSSGEMRQAKAIYDYHAENKFDLSIVTGEILHVFREIDGNWCEVENASGHKGIVPSSYIEFMETDATKGNENEKGNSKMNLNGNDDEADYDPKTRTDSSNYSRVVNHESHTMPILFERSSDSRTYDERSSSKLRRHPAFLSPKPFLSDKPHKTLFNQEGKSMQKNTLMKSTSVDSSKKSQTLPHRDDHFVPRSASYSSSNDSRSHLAAWRNNRLRNETEKSNSSTPEPVDGETHQPPPAPSRFTRATSRSSSMREKKIQHRHEEATPVNDVKMKSDSDLSLDAIKKRQRPRPNTSRRKTDLGVSRHDILGYNRDSASTTSTESSSSFSDTKKQSLHNNKTLQTAEPRTSSSKPAPRMDTIPRTTPVRPAPKLPTHKANTIGSSPTKGQLLRNAAEKKEPPRRPAHPPMAGPVALQQGKSNKLPPRDKKDRMERLRTDIEEYTRMKTELENLYQGTLDGKERREISENKEFVKANLRRLEKEFHDLIADEQDHIYESINTTDKPLSPPGGDLDFSNSSLPPPVTLQPPDSPASIHRKREEKRLLVVHEIVQTERDFVTDVTVTVEDIMHELEDSQIPPSTISSLFVNIEQIKEFDENLLKGFEEALINESSSEVDPGGLTIGQVFINNIPSMKEVYMTYCRNHDDSIKMLEKCESDPDFVQTVNYCLEIVKSKVNVFDLASFLIKPVQRILKYPLLINELIKLTDPPDPKGSKYSDHEKLLLAAKMMQGVANDINEDKRTKDLVRKYKNASNEGLTEKLGRISIKSLKKKSTRISRRIGHVTGITTQETRDVQFDQIEKRFKTLERTLKMFNHNVTSYCEKSRDVLLAELHVSKAITDMVYMPDRTHPVSQYHAVAERMSGPLYRQFHDQVQLQALSPITSLLASFKGPQTIIDKRYDKLLDYEQLQKNSDSKEKIQAAKHDYEALNKSLLDELPKLCDLGLRLLTSCTAIFVQVHKEFELKLLDALNPILVMIQQSGEERRIPNNHEIEDRFKPCHAEAVHNISRLQVVPASFGGALAASKGSAEPVKRNRSSSNAKVSHGSPVQTKQQSTQVRQTLMQKYSKEQLHVSTQAYTASQLLDVSCGNGDLVAVLKRQDPMGSKERWFIDIGTGTGFLPASILKPCNPSSDGADCKASIASQIRSPVPAPRTKSPTPSSRSISSGDSGNTGAIRPPTSPFTLRETLSRGTNLPKEDMLHPLSDDDINQALAEEDEIFDDAEYDVVVASSPKSTKQHFRAQYDFSSRSNLELTIQTGDIVKLIMGHDTDGNAEWWLVSNADGKQGYVPANYLCKAEYL